jgi:hypothetical protein
MNLNSVNWIMGFLSNTSFAVLINEFPSCFFKASRGLHQGFPLSPFMFLIVAKTLRKLLKKAKTEGRLRGLKVSASQMVSDLFFIDDIWVNIFGSLSDVSSLSKALDLLCKETSMKINLDKSCLLTNFFSEIETTSFLHILLVQHKSLDQGVKYLGFDLKIDKYKKSD